MVEDSFFAAIVDEVATAVCRINTDAYYLSVAFTPLLHLCAVPDFLYFIVFLMIVEGWSSKPVL